MSWGFGSTRKCAGDMSPPRYLAYVSPKTGRARLAGAAGPYKRSFSSGPACSVHWRVTFGYDQLLKGLDLTGYFPNATCFGHTTRPFPPARSRFYGNAPSLENQQWRALNRAAIPLTTGPSVPGRCAKRQQRRSAGGNQASAIRTGALERYLSYAFFDHHVRASLPYVRDGLKPVPSRLLYAMRRCGSIRNSAFKKSARVVGDVICSITRTRRIDLWTPGASRPEFAARLSRIEWAVNFGNIGRDNPPPAYTAARLPAVKKEARCVLPHRTRTPSTSGHYDWLAESRSFLPSVFRTFWPTPRPHAVGMRARSRRTIPAALRFAAP